MPAVLERGDSTLIQRINVRTNQSSETFSNRDTKSNEKTSKACRGLLFFFFLTGAVESDSVLHLNGSALEDAILNAVHLPAEFVTKLLERNRVDILKLTLIGNRTNLEKTNEGSPFVFLLLLSAFCNRDLTRVVQSRLEKKVRIDRRMRFFD